MKTPGIFYRISFLVILNSLFIFAAVTLVSLDNNQNQIDQLIEYRFDFISQYFRVELEELRSHNDIEQAENISPVVFDNLFKESFRFMKGLAGLTFLTKTDDETAYRVILSSFRPELEKDIAGAFPRLVAEANPDIIAARDIQVGDKSRHNFGLLKTVYIPWNQDDYNRVLAVTFFPGEITTGSNQYYYTIVVLFLIITLITLLIINLLFRRFIRPLRHLILGMEKTAEGKVIYQIEPISRDEIGRVASSFNVMVDKLWQKRKELTQTLEQLSEANQSLAESKKFLAKLIENAPFAVIVTDTDGHILIFSKAAIEIFGFTREDALEKDFRGFFPYTPEKVFPQSDQTSLSAQKEMICAKAGKETFPALVNRIPIRDEAAEIRAYLFIIRDISESKGFQEMMISIDRMATRGVMAGEIAHEINNYLAVILGNVELVPLLLQRGDMDKLDKKLEVLKSSVAKIQRFSEGLAGDMHEETIVEPNDLNQLIENLVAFVKPQNHYDNIRFKLDLSHRMPLVEIDRGQIQQMLTNLVNNAAGALQDKDGPKEISISTRVNDDRSLASIMVSDNAGGLPDDLEKVIFRERYLGRRRGRGFGLVIVKRIIDRHRGGIEYDSIPGQGTTYTISLPVKAVIADPASSTFQTGQVPA